MAKEAKMPASSMRRLVRKDLKMCPYRLKKRQLLSEVTRNKRLIRAKIFLNQLKSGKAPNLIFSDKKIFAVQQARIAEKLTFKLATELMTNPVDPGRASSTRAQLSPHRFDHFSQYLSEV